jgi:hypothetical protein
MLFALASHEDDNEIRHYLGYVKLVIFLEQTGLANLFGEKEKVRQR